MPRISQFYGISIYVYFQDHAPPHVHAIYGDDEAVFGIKDGQVIDGAIPRRAKRLVEDWMELHRDAIEQCWNDAQNGVPLTAVPPLR